MTLNIIDSVDKKLLDEGLTEVSERYYEHKFCIKIDGVKGKVYQRISFHSNRVCMLSLSPFHPVNAQDRAITKINFELENINRAQNIASGKGKRGAQKLTPDSVICIIETSDGQKYPVYSCIKGKLIEINENLITNPELLKAKPISDGYIALLLPDLKTYDNFKNDMLTYEQISNLHENK